MTNAELLSQQGFFVVVYDERGQGPNDYTYKVYSDDIRMLIHKLHLRNPVLLGHSHGGPISLKFDQYYP